MRIPFVDLHGQYLSTKEEIDGAIAQVIAESAYIRGRHVNAFERAWAQTLGVKRCLSCANGTDALYIALRALDVEPGDEVITSAHSWISTSEAITQVGGIVVFCDTEEETFTIDPIDIEAKIRPATVGIIPVHLYGQPADMDAIMAVPRKHNLWVIRAGTPGQVQRTVCGNLWQRCDLLLLSRQKPWRLRGCRMPCDQR